MKLSNTDIAFQMNNGEYLTPVTPAQIADPDWMDRNYNALGELFDDQNGVDGYQIATDFHLTAFETAWWLNDLIDAHNNKRWAERHAAA